MKLRRNGARDMSVRELKVFKRLVSGGHNDTAIAEMLGRTPRGVRGLREYYGLTDPEKYKRTGAVYSIEEEEVVKNKIRDWVEMERLSPEQMSERLKISHPPGLHRGTLTKWIKRLGPNIWKTHMANMASRRARATALRHQRGKAQFKYKGAATIGCLSQPRSPNGNFIKRGEDNESA